MLLANLDRAIRLKVDRATSGALIAAVASKIIRVLAVDITLAASQTLKFQSNATDLTGAMTITSKLLPIQNVGDRVFPWFVTASGEAFNITLGAGVQVSGVIIYTQD